MAGLCASRMDFISSTRSLAVPFMASWTSINLEPKSPMVWMACAGSVTLPSESKPLCEAMIPLQDS